ncbi:MAG TPA: transglutaminase family protein [Paracoccaceae bacterium]|nr:transglutaminase family protein [Paracoccaceae bacterium]
MLSEPGLTRADCLAPGRYVDSDSAAVVQFVGEALAGLAQADARARSVRLFEAVRDGLRYDPYGISFDAQDYRASAVLRQRSAFCVPKAILLTACLRRAGIPAAVGFADVRNHLNSPRLAELMGTDVFHYHGYVQLWLGGETYKVTPAFNLELCERFGVKPLIFDGHSDALFHEADASGRRHMEYVRERGLFADAPVVAILQDFAVAYPKLRELSLTAARMRDESFHGPADRDPAMACHRPS